MLRITIEEKQNAVVLRFSAISHQTTFPPDATLFVEGQTPRGVFLLCSGKVKLSTSSRDGKVLILKMAGPGENAGAERGDLWR